MPVCIICNLFITLLLLSISHLASVRGIWKDYINDTDSIIFVIDGTDQTRFSEAATELSIFHFIKFIILIIIYFSN